MSEVKNGDKVRFHYTGTFTDGTVFDSSQNREPLEIVVGSGQIIGGLDNALPGLKVGETKRVEVPFQEAYGPMDPSQRRDVARDRMPEGLELEPGLKLEMRQPNGPAVDVTVVEVGETMVTLDANHPLAGKDLVFEVEIVSIN
ncbi:peptidylprolyl isomerase [Ruegeria pomeroyi]|uniref:Peptidyl-prolyl cis-trans isomerase n=1 Tax=Ruegeria alba TaxID=2916756 RepID=A0ABS9P0T4_9RHOB|nr:peptidylprolyl isomerase [Ruegeria alba]MCE8514420.1 peptidylprolyl isomerase [Ruegeria pomeroyi]MCE8522990.1 peptidylprolyl isomerase [Ruegeria pomeroyi]MCE8525531.1 peptidylprolyl isomerase [Ruegeria pomeroyi]MCE8531126.1 peptidylprolyl isomerase [Ruegeria pomeroyi]MCE8535433.1 peptidylprolyl isomerase [Ruegeria pomeroyi]